MLGYWAIFKEVIMPFIPHTDEDVKQMLVAIGVAEIDDLFDEVPANLTIDSLKNVPTGINEMQASVLFKEFGSLNQQVSCFLGAGAYEHHIPAAVWDLTSRGEFMTAYTPYQAEASQGGLQLIYEFQTMMASLTGMDISNASMYEGATALSEAVLMAIRSNRRNKARKVLLATTVNSNYRQVLDLIAAKQNIQFIELAYCQKQGTTLLSDLEKYQDEDIAAVVVQQPNFFGCLEDVDHITDWAHQKQALVVASVNPTSLALLKAPGKWGEQGADIVTGEGQPLGVPLASGGPYFGFMCCKQALVRQMPGRIVGRTVDSDGKQGFTLTLQAREQHIRRAKATSNICTNQGLLVTAATIYMSIIGPQGLKKVAIQSHQNLEYLKQKLAALDDIELVFNASNFHEAVIRLPIAAEKVVEKMLQHGILAGLPLHQDYSELKNSLLVCVTETKTQQDMDNYVACLQLSLNQIKKTSKKAAKV